MKEIVLSVNEISLIQQQASKLRTSYLAKIWTAGLFIWAGVCLTIPFVYFSFITLWIYHLCSLGPFLIFISLLFFASSLLAKSKLARLEKDLQYGKKQVGKTMIKSFGTFKKSVQLLNGLRLKLMPTLAKKLEIGDEIMFESTKSGSFVFVIQSNTMA